MTTIVQFLWLIPALPLVAAGVIAVTRRERRRLAAGLSIASMALATVLSLVTFVSVASHPAGFRPPQVVNFGWFQLGDSWVKLGLLLDPITALMLLMVSFVGLLIFIYSLGYMAEDENFTRFFGFLSLFGAAMLGLVIANSLLLLFICWELVGLTSYLLIGFWFHRPQAAAAAKKAFITTRIGDLALLLGLVWLYGQTGTLLFYDNGNGCLEQAALGRLVTQATVGGMAVSTAISLLIFFGAVGKSGQVPLHVWFPDAMEGPSPVSALIHAATMVAAGVFLVARTYPLMAAGQGISTALQVITWVGAITAIFAASIAVAQTDIKRILAYSTVSQLGYMMIGVGTGGVAVGMFHLITHAFFKALLFLGAGSVIHGCDHEQDIRRLGGLRSMMPATFATYAVGMLALSGFPLLFSGFWSKDEILHAAHGWAPSHWPFYLGVAGALLTAFYMTRQVCYVFFGQYPGMGLERQDGHAAVPSGARDKSSKAGASRSKRFQPHESPRVMLVPLWILAVFSVALGFVGTPAWPWFQSFVEGSGASFRFGNLFAPGVAALIGLSVLVVFLGLAAGWWVYGTRRLTRVDVDPLSHLQPDVYRLLERKYFVDEAYEYSVVRFTRWWARAWDWVERWILEMTTECVSYLAVGLSWLSRWFDEFAVNLGFDKGCAGMKTGGRGLSRFQNGRVQNYLRAMGLAVAFFVVLLAWGCRA